MNYSERLNSLIPGGAHTYSRGDDQYPSNAPQILSRGKGAYVWDAVGNQFLDYGMALRTVTLGYANDEVIAAATEEERKGNQFTRASLTELQAAERITSLIPGMDMVKFGKNGSTVTSAAVKLARAYTGRKYVAICAEHPFFSYDDWFIGSTPVVRGIPEEFALPTLKFHYNNITSLESVFDQHPGKIACVMLEPATTDAPCATECPTTGERPSCPTCPHREKNFLHQVEALCRKHGAVFILDEMITGFRWDLRGAQTLYGVTPDLATFGKGMANGYSVSALVGKRDIMKIGGIRDEGTERVFLISTTHGAEMNSLGAFMKTVEVYQRDDVVLHLWRYGRKLIDGMNALAKKHGLEKYFTAYGYPCSPSYATRDKDGQLSLDFRTLFSQELIAHGVLMPWIALSLSHGPKELEKTLDATDLALGVYAKALNGDCHTFLRGESIKPVFRRIN